MKRVYLMLAGTLFFLAGRTQVVADHTIVDLYDEIPQQWIDSVKTKLVWVHGMSHGYAFFRGAELLEQLDPAFQVDIWYHTDPPLPQSSALRLGRTGFGRESHWTSEQGIENFKNYHVARQNDTGNPYDFIWFGWSYQSVWENDLGGGLDPEYQVHWAGSTQSGTDGNKRWGLDSGDSILTGNRVCMDTYLDAYEQFNQFFRDHNYRTKYFLSNGVSDDDAGTELGFQRELKNQHIRDYVAEKGNDETYFLDYSDILVHNAGGELHEENWNDNGTVRPHQQIHPDNLMDYDENFNIVEPGTDEYEDHIGEVGALRLAKAMWWLLARASGWDGGEASSLEDRGEDMNGSELYIYSEAGRIWIGNADNYVQGQIGLYDLQGRLISQKPVRENRCFFSTASLEAGTYIVVLSKDGEFRSEKVILPL